jgi:hypothetical protein
MGGEVAQTIYIHMNKCKNNKKLDMISFRDKAHFQWFISKLKDYIYFSFIQHFDMSYIFDFIN